MEPSPKISIIIPAYNRAEMLKRAIDSALNQTYKNKEVIVVDDSSTDNTASMLKEYSGKVVIVKNRRNMGGNFSRNVGSKFASGKYLSFLDSDDIFYPEKLEMQIRLFKNKSVIFSGTRFYLSDHFKKIKSRHQHRGDISKIIYGGNFIGGFSSIIVKKSHFIKCGACDKELKSAQDWDLYIRLSKMGNYDYIDLPLFEYGLHRDNIRIHKRRLWDGRERLFNKIEKDIPFRRWKSHLRSSLAQFHPNYKFKRRIKELIRSIKEYPLNFEAMYYLIKRCLRNVK